MVDAREWLIRKDGYYYRPNCSGYTERKAEAGRYTKAEADLECSVEPWHMKAIHQDEIPDEPAIAERDARIAELEAEVERLQARNIEHEMRLDAEEAKSEFWKNRAESLSRTGAVDTLAEVRTTLDTALLSADPYRYIRAALSALEPPAPEGQQEPAGNNYCSFCDVKFFGNICPSCRGHVSTKFTRPPEQTVTEALFEALKWFIDDIDGSHTKMVDFDENVTKARSALKAAIEAGR